MSPKKKTVVVLGNGFTKAFIPQMPLVRDGFDVKPLFNTYSEATHPTAYAILRDAINDPDQGICKVTDIEILMTRLDNLMPYDFRQKVTQELESLYHDLKEEFVNQIKKAMIVGLESTSGKLPDLVSTFAEYCISNQIDCLTFNYDDLLDRALWEMGVRAKKVPNPSSPDASPYWYPDGGYGFYCHPAYSLIRDNSAHMDITGMYLLKLHGSINWRIKLGASEVIGPEDLVHKADWFDPPTFPMINIKTKKMDTLIENHLKPEGFMVLPVLLKGDLKTQPIFRLIWGLAYEKLKQAEEVIFVGYSLPPADIAARFLFRETLTSKTNISVVNWSTSDNFKESIKATYKEVLPWLTEESFNFDGAKNWCSGFNKTHWNS